VSWNWNEMNVPGGGQSLAYLKRAERTVLEIDEVGTEPVGVVLIQVAA
jgi:hypothetical protein